VLEDAQDRADLIRQALKVGYDDLLGELAGGMVAWRTSGRPEPRIEVIRDPAALQLPILDVRQTSKYVAGHIPGATLVELGSLQEHAGDHASEVVQVMCGR